MFLNLYNYVHYKKEIRNVNMDYTIEIFKKFHEYLKTNDKFLVLRNGKIIYKPNDLPYDLIQCNECGNIWDGNAQCLCTLYDICYY